MARILIRNVDVVVYGPTQNLQILMNIIDSNF